MIKEVEMEEKEWLKFIAKGLNINQDQITFVYVRSIIGNNKLTLRYIEK